MELENRGGIFLNISNKIANMSSGDINVVAKESVKKSWSMTNAMKEQIIAYAKEDAKSGVYMGKSYIQMEKAEVAKVAPDRERIKARLSKLVKEEDAKYYKMIKEADERWLAMIFGRAYEISRDSDMASCTHVYNEEGEELVTYTPGSGWTNGPTTKAENKVYQAMDSVYMETYNAERKRLAGGFTGTENKSNMESGGFEAKV